MIDKLEVFMNWLNDMDWGWWPFLFLRPDQNVEMTNRHVAKMSLYYGLPIGLLLGLYFQNLLLVLYVLVIFLVGYRVTFAYFWNRRARRLQHQAVQVSSSEQDARLTK
jgi:hypothetical protein